MATTVKINFGEGVQAWDPSKDGSFVTLPGGIYATKITGFEEKTNNTSGKTRYEVAMEVTDGEHAGATVNGAIFGDFTKASNVQKLVAAIAAIGGDVSKLKAEKELDLASMFKAGRTLHIRVKEIDGKDDQGRPKLPEILFVPKDQVEQLKATVKNAPVASKPETKAEKPAAALDDLFKS
jgi:hypothetical protein